MLKIAVTGGIACGKSLVGSLMEAAGIPVCEADEIARRMLAPGEETFECVVERFGPDIVGGDGTIDRAKLAGRVFSNERERRELNAMLHPRVQSNWEEWLAGLQERAPAAAVIVPLLFEEGMDEGWDDVVCVTSARPRQIERLAERGLGQEEAESRIAAQWDNARKAALADFVIVNNGSRKLLEEQVKRVLERILEREKHGTKKQ